MSYPYECLNAGACEPLLLGLWDHAWTSQPVSEKLIFIFWMAYNSARTALLFKTKKLEMEETARKLPVSFGFSTAKPWDRLFKFVHHGFWFHLLAVLWHLGSYMMTPVPK